MLQRTPQLAPKLIAVDVQGRRTVYRWPTAHRANWLIAALLWVVPPVGMFLTLMLLEPADRSLVIDPEALEFSVGSGTRHRVLRQHVGEVRAQDTEYGVFLTLDEGATRHLLATGDLLPALGTHDLQWLAQQINCWKRAG